MRRGKRNRGRNHLKSKHTFSPAERSLTLQQTEEHSANGELPPVLDKGLAKCDDTETGDDASKPNSGSDFTEEDVGRQFLSVEPKYLRRGRDDLQR